MAFSDSIWWTKKARIRAEKRLLANAFHTQLLLLWYSFFGVAVSIYYLKFNGIEKQSELAGVSWIVFSVLILSVSGFIAGLSLKERAGLIKNCYETLTTLYQKAKKLQDEDKPIEDIIKEYEQVMALCENHTEYDYYLALCIEHITTSKPKTSESSGIEGLDRCPSWGNWVLVSYHFILRFILFSFLYSLPVLIMIFLEISR